MSAREPDTEPAAGEANGEVGEEDGKQDPYIVLGLERAATEEEIKKAFRKKSLKWHPDRNRSNIEEATHMMSEITAANRLLSDPKLREVYNKYGHAGVEEYETYGIVMGVLPCWVKYMFYCCFCGTCCCYCIPCCVAWCRSKRAEEDEDFGEVVTEEPMGTHVPVPDATTADEDSEPAEPTN